MSGFIETYTGGKVYPTDPDNSAYCIDDIAHALALQCRYNGHCREFYSVAQHCCLVHDVCPAGLRWLGLMHDAAEAYLGDVVSPIKTDVSIHGVPFRDIEDDVLAAILHRVGLGKRNLPRDMEKVKPYDIAILLYERQHLLPMKQEWGIPHSKLSLQLIAEWPVLECWSPAEAERVFLQRYKELKG